MIRTRSRGAFAWEHLQFAQRSLESFIAARASSSTLDAKAIALANHMDVRQMRDAPQTCPIWPGVEGSEIAGLLHHGIRHSPYQAADGEIAGDEHGAVGERYDDDAAPGPDLREAAEEVRAGPDEIKHKQRQPADQEAGRNGRGSTQLGVLIFAPFLCEQSFDDLAQHFAGSGVAGLHDDGIQGPEAVLDQAEQGAPAEIAEGDDGSEDEQGPNPGYERGYRAG